jgi:hypothetical protein
MFHCHNLIHEDNDMLRAFKQTLVSGIRRPETQEFITLTSETNKVIYNNWGYNNPLFERTNAAPTSNTTQWPALDSTFVGKQVRWLFSIQAGTTMYCVIAAALHCQHKD